MRRPQPLEELETSRWPSSSSNSPKGSRRRVSMESAKNNHLRGSGMTVVAAWCLLLWCVGSPTGRASTSTGGPTQGTFPLRGTTAINEAPLMNHFTARRRGECPTDKVNGRSSCFDGNADSRDTKEKKVVTSKRRNVGVSGGAGSGREDTTAKIERSGPSASATTNTRHHSEYHSPRPALSAWLQLHRGDSAPGSKIVGEDDPKADRHGRRKRSSRKARQLAEAGQQDGLSARTAAMIKTITRGPSALQSGASAFAASVAAAAQKSQSNERLDEMKGLLPPKSYLLWPSSVSNTGDREVKLTGRRSRQTSVDGGGLTRKTNVEEGVEEIARKRQGSLPSVKKSRDGAEHASCLTFKQAMFAGAVSRSIAQTCMQPANVVKTLLQGRGTSKQLSNLSFSLLTRGAGAQFTMSLPHGAFNYATLEVILGCTNKIFPAEWREKAGPALDFFSSSVATLVCSVVSTPQMVITDRIMAGMYPNLISGVREIAQTSGLKGFYTGWSANVAQKIPSYGLTWVFFQQFKRLHRKIADRTPTNTENFGLGAAAAGATVCIMIPMDTVKTRLVTQTVQAGVAPYRGVVATLFRVIKEEGVGSVYRALTPRLVSVVPMIGIQFGIYEFIRKEIITRQERDLPKPWLPEGVRRKLGLYNAGGAQQHEYVKDFLHNVVLMEEDLV